MSLCECEMCRAQNSYENGSTMNERFGRLERVVNKFACLSFFFFFHNMNTKHVRFDLIEFTKAICTINLYIRIKNDKEAKLIHENVLFIFEIFGNR